MNMAWLKLILKSQPGIVPSSALADKAVSVAKCADAVQDLLPTAEVTGVDNEDGTGTFTVQVKDAAGNDLEQVSAVRVWLSDADKGAPAAATGFEVDDTGTAIATITEDAVIDAITDATGALTLTVTDDGAHYVMAAIGGRVYSGTVTVTTT